MELFLGILIFVVALVLIALVLAQSGKEKSLSGTIIGGAESFLGKNKNRAKDKVLSKITTVLSFVFVIAVVIMYIYIATKV